jgi:hypothetical protein
MQVNETKLARQYSLMLKRVPMKAFMLLKMPAAAFAGLRIESVSSEKTVVSVPGGRRTQNPFGTMYWAVQGMAAELATAVVPTCISRSTPMKLRMFVVGTEAVFGRKAYGRCSFTCSDTNKVMEAFDESLSTGKSVNCDLTAIGTDSDAEVVSEWVFKWNFLATEEQ